MSNANPLNPSFRRPLGISPEDAKESVISALRQHDNNIVDLNQAIVSLKDQITGKNGTTQTITTSTGTTTIINTPSAFPGLGAVNNQVGALSYTTAQTDSGSLILLGATTAIAVTLNSGLTTPFFTTFSNSGTSTAILTPTTGTVNGGASLALPAGSWTILYFDGTNWTADSPGSTAGGVSQLLAGTNITLSPAGGTGIVTVNATSAASGTKLPHDVTATRALGGTYQNTTGIDMEISGYCDTSGGGTGAIQAVIGTATPTNTIWSSAYTATLAGGRAGFNFYVPNTYFYTLNTVGGLGTAITGVGLWVEFY